MVSGITKAISLRQVNPGALLDRRETGKCQLNVPEILFDMDFPGHYSRRIESGSVTVPCVVGPYASINCTLLLLNIVTFPWRRLEPLVINTR